MNSHFKLVTKSVFFMPDCLDLSPLTSIILVYQLFYRTHLETGNPPQK